MARKKSRRRRRHGSPGKLKVGIVLKVEITGHSDCPMWNSNGSHGKKETCGFVCPEWYKSKTGVPDIYYKDKYLGKANMRRPRNCPAKKGILITLKKE